MNINHHRLLLEVMVLILYLLLGLGGDYLISAQDTGIKVPNCLVSKFRFQGELCYWIDQSNTWCTGEKATINIKLDKDYDDWNVTFAYDQEIVNLEAWKGDVTAVNQSTFNVQSKCYNSKLYACQVSVFFSSYKSKVPYSCHPRFFHSGMSNDISPRPIQMPLSTSMESWFRPAPRSVPTWECWRRLLHASCGPSWGT